MQKKLTETRNEISRELCPTYLESMHESMKKYLSKQESVSDMLLIQQQSDLIQQLNQTFSKGKRNQTLSTQLSDMFLDLSEGCHELNCSISRVGVEKEYICKTENSFEIDEAMGEIRQLCSRKTYQTIKQFMRRGQSQPKFKLQKTLQKQKKHNEQLMSKCIKLNEENKQLLTKNIHYQELLNAKQEEKNKTAKKMKKNLEIEERIIKFETGLLYREKMQAEIKRKLYKQQQLIEQEQENTKKTKQEIQQMFDKMCKMESFVKCDGGCWRSDIIYQCRSNLNRQRQFIQLHQEQAQKHYIQIRQIVQQLRNSIQ